MANTTGSNSTLLRGLQIIHYVVGSDRGLSIAELMMETGLPKPTVHRIAVSLEEEGYLQRSPEKRFVAGHALKALGMSVLSNASLGAPRHAILQALSEEIGETCNCTMLDGNNTVYFDRVECNWPIKIDLHPGSKLPLHATASGKLFLAHMKARERKRLLNAAPLVACTERTLTSYEQLEPELKRIVREKISYDNEEFIAGMVAIAVPVYDRDKRICFTVAVHAPSTRKNLDDLRQFIPALQQAADALATCYCE